MSAGERRRINSPAKEPGAAHRIGRLIARVHALADAWPEAADCLEQRPALDAGLLVDRSLMLAAPLFEDRPADRAELHAVAASLRAGLDALVAGLDPDPASFDHEVTLRHRGILESATDAGGRPFQVVVLQAPGRIRPRFESDDFAAGYINFYVCNGAVIAPQFGDPDTDGAAERELARLFPDRRVVQIDIDAVAAGGGGIHCTTQQEPAG